MKKIIALVLSLLMLLSALPLGVFAEENWPHADASVKEAAPVLSDVKAEATSGTTGGCRWTLDGDGKGDSADAIYLLYHALFGADRYPI